jgi:hypothetical protein
MCKDMGIFEKVFGNIKSKGTKSNEYLYAYSREGKAGTTRKCEGCGKSMIGETAKLVSFSGPKQVLVRPYCSQNCADPIVKSFVDQKVCIWCGKKANPKTWELGGLGEPYCCKECYDAAGKAMCLFEMRQGNI